MRSGEILPEPERLALRNDELRFRPSPSELDSQPVRFLRISAVPQTRAPAAVEPHCGPGTGAAATVHSAAPVGHRWAATFRSPARSCATPWGRKKVAGRISVLQGASSVGRQLSLHLPVFFPSDRGSWPLPRVVPDSTVPATTVCPPETWTC